MMAPPGLGEGVPAARTRVMSLWAEVRRTAVVVEERMAEQVGIQVVRGCSTRSHSLGERNRRTRNPLEVLSVVLGHYPDGVLLRTGQRCSRTPHCEHWRWVVISKGEVDGYADLSGAWRREREDVGGLQRYETPACS